MALTNCRSPTGMSTGTIRTAVRRSRVRHSFRRQHAETPRQRAQPERGSPLELFSPPRTACGRSIHRSVPGSAVRVHSRRSARSLPWPRTRRASGVIARGLPATGPLSFWENLCNQRSRRGASDKLRQPPNGLYRKLAHGLRGCDERLASRWRRCSPGTLRRVGRAGVTKLTARSAYSRGRRSDRRVAAGVNCVGASIEQPATIASVPPISPPQPRFRSAATRRSMSRGPLAGCSRSSARVYRRRAAAQ